MKTGTVLAIVAAVLFVLLAAGFGKSTSSSPSKQLLALQAQIKTLKSQVKVLTVRTDATEADALANYQGDACSVAVTSDALQGTWAAVDDLAKKMGQPTYFGPQAPVSDLNSCLVGIARSAPGTPTTVEPLKSVITWAVG
jgi:hypothetical protein